MNENKCNTDVTQGGQNCHKDAPIQAINTMPGNMVVPVDQAALITQDNQENMRTFKEIDGDELNALAWEYLMECEAATTEVATVKGALAIRKRKNPTLRYFLNVWLRKRGKLMYQKSNWYNVLNNEDHPLHEVVVAIDDLFKSAVQDVIANEGTGLFWAKNMMGWAEKMETKNENTNKSLTIKVIQSGPPPARSEREIDLT